MVRVRLPRDPEMLRARILEAQHLDLTARQAGTVARAFDVKRPRVGYEVCLWIGPGARYWLQSTGHFQFGSFGLSAGQAPFVVFRAETGGW